MKKEIKNLKKAAKRILKAVKKKEPIIIYGDSDMDGVSSVIILKEAINSIGGTLSAVHFSDREEEGYGISEKALLSLKKYAPALFITVDLGIGNFKEVDAANKMGFEVIIIDHHEILDKIPNASIVVDPKQKGDKYPFKHFAAVGLVFKLVEEIFKGKMPGLLKKSFLELTAMATIADMMPRERDNEEMIIEGMSYLPESWRPGIKALFSLKDFEGLILSQKIIKANSILNIRDIKEGLPAAYRLLTISDQKEAEKIAEDLFKRNVEKRIKIKEVVRKIEDKIKFKEENIVFEGNKNWDLILLGVAAAIVSKNTKKPVFLYSERNKKCQGSVRAPDGFNTVEAMKACADILITYGGHPKAAGFTIKRENLEKFEKCLIKYFRKNNSQL